MAIASRIGIGILGRISQPIIHHRVMLVSGNPNAARNAPAIAHGKNAAFNDYGPGTHEPCDQDSSGR